MSGICRLHQLTLTAPGECLFAALAAAVPGMSRGQAREAVLAGLVRVDGQVVTVPKHLLGEGSCAVEADLRQGIRRPMQERLHGREPAAPRPFELLHEDGHVVVVDKAAGVLSAPLGSIDGDAPECGHVPGHLRRMWRKRGRNVAFVGVVHRLDKETSGCLALALHRDAQRSLAAQFAAHTAGRTYRCLTDAAPAEDEFTLAGVMGRGPDGRRAFRRDDGAAERVASRHARATGAPFHAGRGGSGRDEGGRDEHDADDEDFDDSRDDARTGPAGRDAVTHVRVLRRFRRGAELSVTLETGRTHQIRVSLLAIGCPVSGDPVYFERRPDGSPRSSAPRAPRMMLHAERLAFDHPATGRRVEFAAPVPAEFEAHARRLDGAAGAPAGRR